LGAISFQIVVTGAGAGGRFETKPVEPLWISSKRSSSLNLCVLAPEKPISNIEVNCSAVGSKNPSNEEINNGLSGSTGGSGLGTTMSMGGLGFGVGLGVGPGVGGVGVGVGGGVVVAR